MLNIRALTTCQRFTKPFVPQLGFPKQEKRLTKPSLTPLFRENSFKFTSGLNFPKRNVGSFPKFEGACMKKTGKIGLMLLLGVVLTSFALYTSESKASALPSHSVVLSPVKLIDRIEELHPAAIDQGEVRILNVVLPFQSSSFNSPSILSKLSTQYKAIHLLRGLQKEMESEQVISQDQLEQIADLLSPYSECDAVEPLQLLIRDLSSGSYESSDIKKYFSWGINLTLVNLQGNSPLDEKVQQLYQRVMHGQDYEIQQRESGGHSPSYFLVDSTTRKPFAILKQSYPELFSSFKSHLPDMPLNAPVWEHELISYEEDQIFGLDHTPATMSVRFSDKENKIVRGTIQEFIANAKGGSSFYNAVGAKLLKSIPKSEVHLVAISGMFKGLSAAHFENYVMDTSSENPEKFKIYEIDQEEMLLPYNRLSGKETMSSMTKIEEQIAKLEEDKEINQVVIAELKQKKQMMPQSLVLGRMWVLGLPQSGKPFDRAALRMMAHPSLVSMLEQYQQEAEGYSSLSQASWNAQMERLKIMQELATRELEKASSTLTPRDVYFAIFGGEPLWEMAQKKKYPATIAFNNLISDPYQHILKDFGNPDSIPVCNRLDKPRDDSPQAREIFEFFRIMEEQN